MELQPGAIVDRYSVVGIIGQGGMASVYHVRHTRLSSDHVLKVISLPGRGIRERLLLEGQVQARLKHRNVVEVTDVIDIQGSPGLVMELVRGPSLDDVLAAQRLSLDLVEQLVPGILAGVAAAHAEGVVHRDLKPANILLSVKRGQVVPKVADFGLVKMLDDDTGKAKTRTGTTMGTPQYMAPEQIQSSKDVDGRADVFALGAILYELVSGRRAFEGDTHYEIFQRVVSRTYPPLLDLRPEAPERMVRAIHAAFSDHGDRPDTAEALWEIWRDGDESLEHAASRNTEWPKEILAQLAEMAPSVVTMGLGSVASSDGASSGSSPTGSETFVGDDVPGQPSAPTLAVETPRLAPEASLPPRSTRRRWWVGMAAALLVLLIGGGATVVGLLGGAWFLTGTEDTLVSPPPEIQPAQAPDPVPDVTPTQPDPEPAIDPMPETPPVPVVPKQKPDKPKPGKSDKSKSDKPKPNKPDPAPAVGTGIIRVQGGVPVTLTGSDGMRHPPGELPAGPYTVSASFPTGQESFGSISLADGQTLTITCVEGLSNCGW